MSASADIESFVEYVVQQTHTEAEQFVDQTRRTTSIPSAISTSRSPPRSA